MLASITELAVTRQTIIDLFGDDDNENEAIDLANMDKLYAVENQIVNAPFETDAEMLVVCRILLEQNDPPDFADSFKQKLFSRLHQSA